MEDDEEENLLQFRNISAENWINSRTACAINFTWLTTFSFLVSPVDCHNKKALIIQNHTPLNAHFNALTSVLLNYDLFFVWQLIHALPLPLPRLIAWELAEKSFLLLSRQLFCHQFKLKIRRCTTTDTACSSTETHNVYDVCGILCDVAAAAVVHVRDGLWQGAKTWH